MGRREVRAVKQAAVKVLDPERDVRAARDALEIADTAANRWRSPSAWRRKANGTRRSPITSKPRPRRPAAIDRAIRLKLAKACFEAGRSARARELLESLPPSGSPSENDRASLLLARLLEEGGDRTRALAIYADVGERLPGAEAQCRQAALLIADGRRAEALPLLVEAERRARRMDRHERGQGRRDVRLGRRDIWRALRAEGLSSAAARSP